MLVREGLMSVETQTGGNLLGANNEILLTQLDGNVELKLFLWKSKRAINQKQHKNVKLKKKLNSPSILIKQEYVQNARKILIVVG
jgi:hypothetical protein